MTLDLSKFDLKDYKNNYPEVEQVGIYIFLDEDKKTNFRFIGVDKNDKIIVDRIMRGKFDIKGINEIIGYLEDVKNQLKK